MSNEEMRAAVFAKKKGFAVFVEEWGERTWLEYYAQTFPDLQKPSPAILSAIEYESGAILGREVGRKARESVASKKWVSSADHHGLLCHPYFYSSALAQSDGRVRREAEALVTLPFGNISLGNDSFPRGFFFHDANFEPHHFLFKSLRERSLPVCALAPVSRENFLKECDRVRVVPLSHEARSRLTAFLETLRDSEMVWSQEMYGAQLTAMNAILWRTLFGSVRGELVYLEIDSVVRRLLLEKHLVKETCIQRLLCDATWRAAYEELFSGVSGSHTESSGTHFFWYVDRVRCIRRSLRVQGDVLTTEDGEVEIPLSPESLSEKLHARDIVPSSALLLLIVHAEEKLACAGGLSQLDYLPHMMKQWRLLLERFSEALEDVPHTGIFAGEQVLFSIADAMQKEKIASLLDLLLYGSAHGSMIERALETMPLAVTIDAMMPTLYWLVTRMRVVAHPTPYLSRITLS